jgi:hypothetical protein
MQIMGRVHGKGTCKCQLDLPAYRPRCGWPRMTLGIPHIQRYRSALTPRRKEVEKRLMNVEKILPKP